MIAYWIHLFLGAIIIIAATYSIKITRFPAFNQPFFFAAAAGAITFIHSLYILSFMPAEHTLPETLILTTVFALLVLCFVSFAMRIKRIIA
jgi:hypothetical protein